MQVRNQIHDVFFIVALCLLKFADGVLKILNRSGVVVTVRGIITIVILAVYTVTLRIAQPASLETLAIALLAPRLLASACLGRDLEDLRCPGRVFSFLSNLWASASAHGSRNLDYLVPLSEQKYGGLSFLVALDVLAANTTALRPAELFAILQALTV